MPKGSILALCLAGSIAAQDFPVETLRYRDLAARLAKRFDAAAFDSRIEAIERDTATREREGEFDHLIYYALQSQRFTKLPRIEPALSAKEYLEKGDVPQNVRARLQVFLVALEKPGNDERMRYFAQLLTRDERSVHFLEVEYRRGMRFLYEKEFDRRGGVYETRGHSTDTQAEANYPVWQGLQVLKELAGTAKIRRVLIVGPGLDFAPRTALYDAVPPQSFQPYAVADAVLSLGLGRSDSLEIDCADINDRVIEFIRRFPHGERRLELYSEPGDQDYVRYFRALGSSIGSTRDHRPFEPLPSTFLAKTVQVDRNVAAAVRAAKLNILTQRWKANYDLVIATNIFVYFSSDELALALANVGAMIAPGGWLLHNEVRPELDEISESAGLEAVQARSVRVAEGRRAPLFDAFAIYRKSGAGERASQ